MTLLLSGFQVDEAAPFGPAHAGDAGDFWDAAEKGNAVT